MSDVSKEIKHCCISCAITSTGLNYAFHMIENSIFLKEKLNTSELSAKVHHFLNVVCRSKAINNDLRGKITTHRPTIKAETCLLNFECPANKNDEFRTIEITCGVNYKEYLITMTRTVLIDPTVEVMENVHFIEIIYKKVLEHLKSGILLYSIYEVVKSFAESKNKYLSKHLEIGFQLASTGQHTMAIDAEENMIFVISINLVGLKHAERNYDLKYSDSVVVKNERLPVILVHPKHRKKIYIIKSHELQLQSSSLERKIEV